MDQSSGHAPTEDAASAPRGADMVSERVSDTTRGAAMEQIRPVSASQSAPVSSLLPQPSNNGLMLNHALQQARYAMLLQAAGTLEQQVNAATVTTTNNPLAGLATLSQHLANQNSFNSAQSAAASISSASMPTIQTAAQLLATHNAVSALTATATHYGGQSLASLENQANLLNKLNQPVPQTLALLLADARRREEKKHAKRIANRKSASTSRARKKALVQEMTGLNARLRRQALILSLLPDLVIVTDSDGVINFCSEQVERITGHNATIIVGSAIEELLVPSSRDKMKQLIQALVENEALGAAETEDGLVHRAPHRAPKATKKEKRLQVSEDPSEEQLHPSAKVSGVPLSVVQVDASCHVAKTSRDDADNSDASRDSNKQASSLTGSTGTLPRSPNPSDSDDNKKTKDGIAKGDAKSSEKESGASDDNSNASSLSIEGDAAQDAARKLQSANANLERNVRWHNKNMKIGVRGSAEFKDDVLGATVTANNATARLSSLRVQENEELVSSKDDKNPLSSEDDSGYRESNDSREETSSSTSSDTSSKDGGRQKPMAPTCNVCLIRDDLTTVWCEVTSSIRTRSTKPEDDTMADEPRSKASASSNASDTDTMLQDTIKEIYLCLRPIRSGRHKVDEKYRFPRSGLVRHPISEGSKTGQSSGGGDSSQEADEKAVSTQFASKPPKKRKTGDQLGDKEKRVKHENFLG